MKHAAIIAHPNPRSLTCAVATAYAEVVRELGHEVVVRDLYRFDFDPRLKAHEIPGAPDFAFGEDVRRERALLADADVFAFFYPFWFNAPPAILKGYVDRVFSMDFGYEPAVGGVLPLLADRRLISFTSSGAPEDWVRQTGAMTALTTLFDAHLAAVCGLRLLDHVHTGGVVPDMTPEAVDQVLAKTRAAARRAFADDLAGLV